MFKITGIILAFIASSAIGFYKAYEIRRRKDLLVWFRDLLMHMETEMGYFKAPLPIILSKLITDENTPENLLLRQCYLQTERNHENFFFIWRESVEAAYLDEPLTEEDFQILIKCGDFLGQSDYQSQKQHFALVYQQMEKQIQAAEAAIKTKGSLYSKAGLSIGAVLAIALI